MNINENDRLTLVRRLEMVNNMLEGGLTPAEGAAGLVDRPSRPQRSPRTIAPEKALAILELRRRRLTQARIATSLGVSKSIVGRVLSRALRIKHSFTRPYRPQTNGEAERFIQSALREWAYGIPYNHSTERADMLERWTHHYNWHRPHQGIGGSAPISRLAQSGNNLLTLHS